MVSDTTLSSNEEWRPVVGYEGLYEVSDSGQICRIIHTQGKTRRRAVPPYETRGNLAYKRVRLTRNGKNEFLLIHRVVAIAFFGAIPNGHVVNHKDGCKHNNASANLEYVTPLENAQHASRLGLLAKGSRIGISKLTENDIRRIRFLSRSMSLREIAAKFGVTKQTIFSVLKGQTWRHVTDNPASSDLSWLAALKNKGISQM